MKKWFSFSVRTFLLILVLGVISSSLIDLVEGGKILRSSWRRSDRRPYSPWRFYRNQHHQHHPRFRRPNLRRFHLQQQQLQDHPELPKGVDSTSAAAAASPASTAGGTRKISDASLLTPAESWHPLLNRPRTSFGNAIARDPTFDYAPPTNERVKFISETQRRSFPGGGRARPPMRGRGPPRRRFRPGGGAGAHRRQWNRRKTQYTKEPSLLMKLFSHRRRWRNPHRRPPMMSPPYGAQAEAVPFIPNIVFFQHADMIPTPTTNKTNSTDSLAVGATNSSSLRPGTVSNVPLYPLNPSSPSEFTPVTSPSPLTKEYIFRVVELKPKYNMSTATTGAPAAARPTPAPAYKSVPSPPGYDITKIELTSTTTTELSAPVELLEPPKPIAHFEINIDATAEGSDHFLKVVVPEPSSADAPTTTIPTTSTTTTSTTTVKPIFTLREEPAIVEEIIEDKKAISSSSKEDNKKPSFHHLLPTYQNNKKKITSLAPKAKPSSAASPSASSKEEMSSSITITGIRSKVKEYKPNLLANFTQLIAFDKVIDRSGGSSVEAIENKSSSSSSSPDSLSASVVYSSPASPIGDKSSSTSNNNNIISVSSSTSESTSLSSQNGTAVPPPSPMQQFDPLQLIHSWFMKT